MNRQLSIKCQYSYMFRHGEIIIRLAFQNVLKEMYKNAMTSHFQQCNLYIHFDDLAKPEHVAVLIFYKKLCSMVICVFIYLFIYLFMIKILFVFCTQIFKYNLPGELLKVLTDQPFHFKTNCLCAQVKRRCLPCIHTTA